MDEDRLKGKANEAAGTVRQKAGKAMGDDEMRAKGMTQEAEGKGQGAMGKAKDKLKGLRNKI